MNSVVSVILTVFNRTQYLKESLASVLQQTFEDWELIVTDDSNSPQVRGICREFSFDRRVRYRANVTVLGAPMNVAAAIDEAQGDYVTILNDDDVLEPDMLQNLLSPLFRHAGCVVSFGKHSVIDASGRILAEETEQHSRVWSQAGIENGGKIDNPLNLALRGWVSFAMGTIFRRSRYQSSWLIPEVAGAYDAWLALQFALSGDDFYFCPSWIFRYRVHDASESARPDPEKTKTAVFVFTKLAEDIRTAGHHDFITRWLAHFLFVLGRERLYFGDRKRACGAFCSSLKCRFSINAVFGIVATFIPIAASRWFLQSWRSLRGCLGMNRVKDRPRFDQPDQDRR